MRYPEFRFRSRTIKVKTRWLVGAGFVAGLFLAAPPMVSVGTRLVAAATHPEPTTTPAPTSEPTTTPAPTTAPTEPPTGGGGTGSTGGGEHPGSGTGGTGTGGTGPSDGDGGSTTPPTPYPSPTPTPSTTPPPTGPSGLLFTDTFQDDAAGTTPPAIGQGTVIVEGDNHYLSASEARIGITRPGWQVTNVSAAVREHGSIAAVGVTDGSTAYFCALDGGLLKLNVQTGDGFTTLASTAYTSDGTGVWEILKLETVNGHATCATGNGQAVVHGGTDLHYVATTAILQSRIHSMTQSTDFDEISISGRTS